MIHALKIAENTKELISDPVVILEKIEQMTHSGIETHSDELAQSHTKAIMDTKAHFHLS
ncbi:MAG: hypothetical protein ACK4SF_17760 [Algoriphagus aquaeductus]|uniref:hypothetical protein n=1 Tax=Algoriphagus TaxID=246875 RepID=UPI0015EB697A|nr:MULTISPECIES: hypothetical protein [Algoriphagus]